MSDIGRSHHEIIPEYAAAYPECRVFVETGTSSGETSNLIKELFDVVFTIEIDPNLARAADKLFYQTNVIPLWGDSETILPLLVAAISKPAIFFLDAHWDHDATERRGNSDTPVASEIITLLDSGIPHVILIDDARFFKDEGLRDEEYPAMEWVEKIANDYGYDSWNLDDVIRLTPPIT